MRATTAIFYLSPLLSCALAAPSYLQGRQDCGPLDNTTSSYVVQQNDTIFSIANSVNRGVCDIARYNKMARADLIFVGENLTIPAQVCTPDSTTCLLTNNTNAEATCIPGGPHTYTTFPGDTYQFIANVLFNITAESIADYGAQTGARGIYEELAEGTRVKIPVCENTQCLLSPVSFTYGTFKDLANNYNTTVGQIMSLNQAYNYSTEAPSISMPYFCHWNP